MSVVLPDDVRAAMARELDRQVGADVLMSIERWRFLRPAAALMAAFKLTAEYAAVLEERERRKARKFEPPVHRGRRTKKRRKRR